VPLRTDREDVTAQQQALDAARSTWREALATLARVAAREGLSGVAEEAEDVARALGSRAKRPSAVDGAALAGEVSAARRHAVLSDEFDQAADAARDAETAVDLAVHDLATASGADG
jgi:hypothetical protein